MVQIRIILKPATETQVYQQYKAYEREWGGVRGDNSVNEIGTTLCLLSARKHYTRVSKIIMYVEKKSSTTILHL